MLLLNNGKNDLIYDDYRLAVGKTLDTPESIAQLWLGYRGVSEVKPITDEKEVVKEAVTEKEVTIAPRATKRKATKK